MGEDGRKGGPVAPQYTTQTPGQKRLEAGAPETAWASRPAPRSPVPFLCPGRASPSVYPQHFLPPSPSSPPGLSLSLSPAASPLFSVHICFSLPCLHGSPRPPSLSHPSCLYPFISPLPLALPLTEVASSRGQNFKRRSKLCSPIKDQTLPGASPPTPLPPPPCRL